MRRAILMTLLMLPTLILAQETTGRIAGKVIDEQGNPIAGARVTILSPSLQGERVVETDAEGEFRAALLPVGPYAVSVASPGKQTAQVSLRLTVGQTVPVTIEMKEGQQLVEEVMVLGNATPLETTALGQNFNYTEDVEQLPMNVRTLEGVAEYGPNIQFGPTPDTIAISGAPSFDTLVLLDGAEISDPYFGSAPTVYFEDAIEELQVITAGVSARYGRFQGGVLNAITKTGGNTFDGSVRWDFFKDEWDSQTPFGETQSDKLSEVYQASVGGYVVKDRLWFFVGGRTIPTEEVGATTVVTSDSYFTTTEEDRWQVKLRGAITPDHNIEVSHLDYDRTLSDRAGLPAGDLFALGPRVDPRDIQTLSYQGVLKDNLYLDIRATNKDISIGSGGDPAKGSPFFDLGGSGAVFHNHWWDVNDVSVRDNQTLAANLTHVLSTGRWGTHTLEYGAQFVESTTGGENRQSSTGFNLLSYDPGFVQTVGCPPGESVCFNLDPAQTSYRWVALPLGGDQKLENLAFYVHDSYEVRKWRFDAGMRYEKYDGSGPLPQFDVDFNHFSPRVGVTYNLNDDWQIQGTYGTYVSRFNDAVANEVTGVSSAPRIETIFTGPACTGCTYDQIEAVLRDDANWGIVTAFLSPELQTRFLATNIEAPHANDLTLSIKRALPRNRGYINLTYTDREYKDLLDDFVGGICDLGIDFGQPCPAGNTTDIPDPSNPGGPPLATVDNVLWANSPQATRDYEAITLTADYRPSAKWSVGGNYTYSETLGNYEGEGRNQPSSGSPIGDFPNSRPEEAAVPFGLLDEDITHRINVWGNYRLDFGRAGNLILGSIARFESGEPYSLSSSFALNDDPGYVTDVGQYTHFFGGRGTRRFEDLWSLDLSSRYQFPIWRDLEGWVKATVLNVTDNDELIAFQVTGTADAVNAAGTPIFQPTGNCDLDDDPFLSGPRTSGCSGYGRIRNENDYQTPREFRFTVGLRF